MRWPKVCRPCCSQNTNYHIYRKLEDHEKWWIRHTWNASSNLDVTDTVLIAAEDCFCLVWVNGLSCRETRMVHASTKFAQLPSSSTPRVLNLVPALFHPNLDIRERVTRAGEPFVGGEGNAMVNTPTYPCMANIYAYASVIVHENCAVKLIDNKLALIQVRTLLRL